MGTEKLLLVLSLVCFLAAAVGVPTNSRFNFIGAGLSLVVLSWLLG